MKYANIEVGTNKLLGWYDDAVHKVIPTPKIEVSKQNWNNAILNDHNKVNDDGSTELFDFRTDEEKEKAINQKIYDDKWNEYYNYMSSLTIDIVIDENTTHKYNASPDSLIVIERKAKSPYLLEVKEIKWFEDWGEFMTNKIELEKVILESDRLSQNKLIEIFGE